MTAMNTAIRTMKQKWKWRARRLRHEHEARAAMRSWLMI
jgi:hypothetical protein